MSRTLLYSILLTCTAASALSAAIPRSSSRPIPRGVAETVESVDAGRPVTCVDVRSGSLFQFQAQRILSSGVIDTSWTPDSSRVCLGSADGHTQRLISDGSGGAFIAWVDRHRGYPDVRVGHVDANGSPMTGWSTDGTQASTVKATIATRRNGCRSLYSEETNSALVVSPTTAAHIASPPPYSDALPEDSEYNQLFSWYCEAEYHGGVEDPDRARRLLTLLRTEVGRRDFEMIEAGRVGDRPRIARELLGYDLSSALSYSLLSWGLDLHHAQGVSQLPAAIQDICALVEAHFKPQLNQNGLFSDEHAAAFCLRSMMALQALSPGLWENEEASDFQVVTILKVDDEYVGASDNSSA